MKIPRPYHQRPHHKNTPARQLPEHQRTAWRHTPRGMLTVMASTMALGGALYLPAAGSAAAAAPRPVAPAAYPLPPMPAIPPVPQVTFPPGWPFPEPTPTIPVPPPIEPDPTPTLTVPPAVPSPTPTPTLTVPPVRPAAAPPAKTLPATVAGARAHARSVLSSRQWQCLDTLWEHESNWRHLVRNPSSGAYGIPQALPASKMASAGADWRTNPITQVKWGLTYIKNRYGTPCGAWSHWLRTHWY